MKTTRLFQLLLVIIAMAVPSSKSLIAAGAGEIVTVDVQVEGVRPKGVHFLYLLEEYTLEDGRPLPQHIEVIWPDVAKGMMSSPPKVGERWRIKLNCSITESPDGPVFTFEVEFGDKIET